MEAKEHFPTLFFQLDCYLEYDNIANEKFKHGYDRCRIVSGSIKKILLCFPQDKSNRLLNRDILVTVYSKASRLGLVKKREGLLFEAKLL